MDFNPAFRSLPLFRLAGIRRWHAFADAPQTIPPQWDDFKAANLPGIGQTSVTYGVTCEMDEEGQRFAYLAGYEVPDFDGLPEGADRMIIAEAEYAVFTLDSVADIRPFWMGLCEWLPNAGFKMSHTPNFERYDERFDAASRGPLEIWLPIER